jgi:hypothetical protein
LTIKIGNGIVGASTSNKEEQMSRRTVTLTDAQRQKLIHYRDHDPHPYVRERCAAIVKIADGSTPHAVARHGLLKPRDPDTVYAWLRVYETSGLAGLLARQQGGRRRHGP